MAVQTTTQSRAVRRVHGGRNAGRSLVRRGRVERRNRCGEDQTVERQRSVACEALVRIRFARYGRIHSPFYRVVAIDSRKKRSGRPAEFLGWYNPMTKETQLDAPNIRKWLESTCSHRHSSNSLSLSCTVSLSASVCATRRQPPRRRSKRER